MDTEWWKEKTVGFKIGKFIVFSNCHNRAFYSDSVILLSLLPELWQRDTELWFCCCDDLGDVQAFSLINILIHILHPQQQSFTRTLSAAPWGTDHNNCWTPGNIFLHLRQTRCDVYCNPVTRKKMMEFYISANWRNIAYPHFKKMKCHCCGINPFSQNSFHNNVLFAEHYPVYYLDTCVGKP